MTSLHQGGSSHVIIYPLAHIKKKKILDTCALIFQPSPCDKSREGGQVEHWNQAKMAA